MIDTSLRERWQAEKLRRWTPRFDQSHEAYIAWWREHGGEDEDSYTIAHHVECHMRGWERAARPPRCRNLYHLYDFFHARYGALVGAEAFRRALTAMAVSGG